MTVDRAIEIFDPDNPKTYKDAAEIEEAMRFVVETLRTVKEYNIGTECLVCGTKWLMKSEAQRNYCPNCGERMVWNA